jgi:disulfide bond formation protein DsbB
MNNDKRRILFVAFLAFFSLIILAAQFFHQEKTLQPMDNCPICLWQMNTVALAGLCLLTILIIFAIFRYLRIFNDEIHFTPSFYHYFLRGPPSNQ